MVSNSFQTLQASIAEINKLKRLCMRTTGKNSVDPDLIRAVGRSAIVLLYSHFEKYIYSINEEIADFINSSNIEGNNIPESLRLLHSKSPIEQLTEMQWIHRTDSLENFMVTDSWLWVNGQNGTLIPDRLLEWMKSAAPTNILRYFRYWGIDDIFSAITRSPHTRSFMWIQIQALVDKRNNIAHGDATVEVSGSELNLSSNVVLSFCERADRVLSRQIKHVFNSLPPW